MHEFWAGPYRTQKGPIRLILMGPTYPVVSTLPNHMTTHTKAVVRTVSSFPYSLYYIE